jgi:Gas vesicle synthesis protein GvpL/GvpF
LAEVLSHNPQAARLRDQIQGVDEIASRDTRIQLGEIINTAVTATRELDTRALGQAMDRHCVASVVRDPTHELDIVHVAPASKAAYSR